MAWLVKDSAMFHGHHAVAIYKTCVLQLELTLARVCFGATCLIYQDLKAGQIVSLYAAYPTSTPRRVVSGSNGIKHLQNRVC